ncbi:MAG: TlyA family RNA methyltransferase [Spirochaetes bacterium]|jgi:23S rRNA (cytidine1920-2'-O)/16S rRNA (cytidine1409-2'-O)-methyltransferase|nr:TlyA family RNA methyltransferase [Spirochaetota bacterium]
MKNGIRLDAYLAENALSPSREKAKREILAGWVRVDGETVRVPSRLIRGTEDVRVERPGGSFASRGGEKLDRALDVFAIDPAGRIVADLGASTGGFTDCLLKRGAALVYAVDVGYGQLDYGLRVDERVVVIDRTNVRNLSRGDFDRVVDLVTADLSFISLAKAADAIVASFAPAEGVMLIKPQFEAGKGEHRKGVVRNAAKHAEILQRVIRELAPRGLGFRGLCHSPIKGPAGNIEFFLHADIGRNFVPEGGEFAQIVNRVVGEAHLALHDVKNS